MVIASEPKMASKAAVNLESRSRMRKCKGHCCVKAKGPLAMQRNGEASPSDTSENRNKPDV